MSSLRSIPDTFSGADVFITGGSGFMGKVLIEKLLRSCPGVGKVFVLIRERRGKTGSDRIDELVKVPLFDVIRQNCPKVLDKLVPVNGDCSQLKLGLDDASWKQLENVQFVFHAAASVRFDDPLQKAILLNTRGTREALEWASTLKKLKAFIHVSTTFSNCELAEIEERLYPAKMNWKKSIELAETLNTEVLEVLSAKLLGDSPNTYTYSKSIAEHVANDYGKRLPVVIFRPAVVTSAEKEPLPGWIDNFNGPAGLAAGCASGVLRTGCINMKAHIDCIPVDVCIKAILVAAWLRAHASAEATIPVPVYNCAPHKHKSASFWLMVDEGIRLNEIFPVSRMLWKPSFTNYCCMSAYYLAFFLYQLLPSLLFDIVLRTTGHKPMLMKLQRKIFHAVVTLGRFNAEWIFHSDNYHGMQKEILEEDRKQFGLAYMNEGITQYGLVCHKGGRRYLFKDPDSTLPQAVIQFNRMVWLDRALKLIWYGVSSILVYIYAYPLINCYL
ncbi:fatty acyl-CoA reductase wat-like [Uranotaenia lowii]|uniref:fatty acyl-CoA reductase wat-like n=1 Tax=Uranotaenia lowii TaxID=190385 RepID=UPI00247966E2|nr:fatty acyl-CoA reductase wat-like [Uranotaenia lowii]